jgi:NAD(P)-dependent dehydrogenase (short-subunit alcohol dehydrogenase family)
MPTSVMTYRRRSGPAPCSTGPARGTDRIFLMARVPGTTGPLDDLSGPAGIAEAVAFPALDRAAFITGEVLNVAAGAYLRN